MTNSTQATCLIHQSVCGRTAGEPICSKCGLDERVRYVSEEASLLAVSKAESSYWKKHAEELQTQVETATNRSKPVPKPRKGTRAKQAKSASADSKAVAPQKADKEFMQALYPSAALAKVVGSSPLPRTEIVSKIWTYVKSKSLQDALYRRMINCDAVLFDIFGKKQVSMFEMAGLIGRHLTDKPSVPNAPVGRKLDPEHAWPFTTETHAPAEAPQKKGWLGRLFS